MGTLPLAILLADLIYLFPRHFSFHSSSLPLYHPTPYHLFSTSKQASKRAFRLVARVIGRAISSFIKRIVCRVAWLGGGCETRLRWARWKGCRADQITSVKPCRSCRCSRCSDYRPLLLLMPATIVVTAYIKQLFILLLKYRTFYTGILAC